jgi:dihydroxy-acid dehydratase
MQVCFGNLAPEGIVFKVSSMKTPAFSGSAVCFNDPRDIVRAVEQRRITPGSVIVLRYLGPVASGMPEVLIATAALAVPELDGKIAFISDARVSGVSHGAIGVHCAPEAIVGGPIAFVEDGDQISFDLLAGTIHVDVSNEQFAARRARHQTPELTRVRRGYLADWSATAAQASHGCVSLALHPQCRSET